ncbi:MAG: hypothetical protein M5U17_08345 [Ignavibacterium sp.]|nr:hypothetical protein [Ignavibacterium sp.]
MSALVNAQIKIKEKVEINPQTIVISDDPVNSYYCNHIYYPYYYQQTFGEMQCLRAFCDTSVVWYGEDFYNFCFLPTVTKSINVVEGSEYVQIYLGYVPSTSETGSCSDCTEYFLTTDNLFLQPDGECTYIKFNETKPTDTAFVKIVVTDYSDEVYTFNVFVVNPVFTLFDYTFDHNLKRNTQITLDVCASPQFGYSLNLPDTTKYNVEIITGSDFGNLVNNTTSDSGQVLNDLPHNYGCLDQIILRTNDQIQADSEIKIRVSTSDPSIEPIEITFTNLLVVNIVPETIAPGDSAQIIPKMKNPDGSLSDFPIEQTFEIGMLDGCALGMIKTATDSGVYVDAALQPFYFIADTGAVEGTVKLRVGVIEGMSSSSLLNNNFKSRKSEYQVKKSSANDNRREAKSFIDGGVIGEYCFLGDLYSVVTGDANVVVEDGCDEEIVVCTNLEPQILKEESFLKLRREEDYKWKDKAGNNHTSNTGNACLYQPPNTGILDLGKCYVFEIIGNYAASTDPYYLLDDAIIKACLDETDPNNPQWQFNVENLRIPVFADTCSLPSHYIDLIDGQLTKIKDRVPHCDFYKGAVEVLNYFEKGPYYQPGIDPKYSIVFSAGIDAHENEHYLQTIREVIRYFKEEDVFKKIRDNYRIPKNDIQSCPESAIALVEDLIKKDLINAILEGSDLKTRMGFDKEKNEYKTELEADKTATETYITIKQSFKMVGTYKGCK